MYDKKGKALSFDSVGIILEEKETESPVVNGSENVPEQPGVTQDGEKQPEPGEYAWVLVETVTYDAKEQIFNFSTLSGRKQITCFEPKARRKTSSAAGHYAYRSYESDCLGCITGNVLLVSGVSGRNPIWYLQSIPVNTRTQGHE